MNEDKDNIQIILFKNLDTFPAKAYIPLFEFGDYSSAFLFLAECSLKL